MAIMSKIETTSKVSVKLPSRINLGRQGAHSPSSTLTQPVSFPTALKGPNPARVGEITLPPHAPMKNSNTPMKISFPRGRYWATKYHQFLKAWNGIPTKLDHANTAYIMVLSPIRIMILYNACNYPRKYTDERKFLDFLEESAGCMLGLSIG